VHAGLVGFTSMQRVTISCSNCWRTSAVTVPPNRLIEPKVRLTTFMRSVSPSRATNWN